MKQSNTTSIRIEVAVFVSVVFALSTVLYLPLILSGESVTERPVMIITLMWIPAIAAGLTRIIRPIVSSDDPHKRSSIITAVRVFGLGGEGRRIRTVGAILGAILFPIVVAAIAYGAAWKSGLADFISPTEGIQPLPSLFGEVIRAATLGTLFGTIIVLGEEIGWRGFLSRALQKSDVSRPILVGGIIWAGWHIPLILTGQYAGGPVPILSALTFSVLAVTLHALWSRMYFATGSLWPAILGHSAWNTIVQYPFDRHTAGENAALWVGDSGILVVIVAALLGVVANWRSLPIRPSTPHCSCRG